MGRHREIRSLVAGGAVDAQPDPSAYAKKDLHPARTGAEPHVAGRAVGDSGLDLGDAIDLRIVEMNPVRVPDVVAGPAKILHELHRSPAESLDAEPLFVERLGEVRVQTNAVPARQRPPISHQLPPTRKQPPSPPHTPPHPPLPLLPL